MLVLETKSWYQKKWLWFLILIGIPATVYAYYYLSKEQVITYQTEKIVSMDIDQVVSVTGKVNADPQVDLNFQATGKIVAVHYEVGDEVEVGSILAELDSEDQGIALERAQAELNNAEAQLAQKMAGSKLEEIKVAEAQVQHAENDVRLKELEIQNIDKTFSENQKKAQLQKDEADLALDKAEIKLQNTFATTEEATKAATQEVETARVNLNKVEIELQNTVKNTDKSIDDNYERLYIALNDSLQIINKSLLEADRVFGVNNPTLNDSFERILGAYEFQSIVAGERAFAVVNDSYRAANASYAKLPRTDKEQMQITYSLLEKAINDADLLMDTASFLVDNVVANQFFNVAELDALKEKIFASQSALKGSKDALTAKYQIVTDSLLKVSTLDEQARASYIVSQNNYESAKLNLSKIMAEGNSAIDIAGAEVKQAANVVHQAEQQIESVKIETENALSQSTIQKDLSLTALNQARANLTLIRSGPREVDLRSLRAAVEQAKAQVKAAEYNIGKTRIISPVKGIIAKLNVEEGEVYSGATSTDSGFLAPVITIIADRLQVEADVSETDITKINIGDPVVMTFDAFAINEIFSGTVSHIDPAETIISGVVYYKVKAAFDIEYEKIKSGMTANLDIMTDKRLGVLAAPIRGIIFDDALNGRVKILQNGQVVDQAVELGLEGDTYIEVLSGLQEGDEVIMNHNGT